VADIYGDNKNKENNRGKKLEVNTGMGTSKERRKRSREHV
jgi:hypothetical protein